MTNVIGTFNVLEAVRNYSPNSLVAYSSTNKVYGDLLDFRYDELESRFTIPDYPNGFDESLRLDFASPYGCSKGAADQYVRDWHRNFGLKTVVFRHSSIYGGRQFSTYDQGWIGWFCQKALEQFEAIRQGQAVTGFTIAGTGKQVRDVLHAQDLIRLYHHAYHYQDVASGQIYNIGGGIENSLSLMELFQHLEEILVINGELMYDKLPARQSDQLFFVADIHKAGKELVWTPEITAKNGLVSMLDWTKEQTNSSKL